MNRKILLKLIVCDAALAALVLAFSWVFLFGKQSIDVFEASYFEMLLYEIVYGGMAAPVALVLLTIAFTWATFRISGPCKRWQLVMAVNALICMAAGPGVFAIILAWGRITLQPFFTFSRMMFWTGLLAIALSFPLKRLRRKGLGGIGERSLHEPQDTTEADCVRRGTGGADAGIFHAGTDEADALDRLVSRIL